MNNDEVKYSQACGYKFGLSVDGSEFGVCRISDVITEFTGMGEAPIIAPVIITVGVKSGMDTLSSFVLESLTAGSHDIVIDERNCKNVTVRKMYLKGCSVKSIRVGEKDSHTSGLAFESIEFLPTSVEYVYFNEEIDDK